MDCNIQVYNYLWRLAGIFEPLAGVCTGSRTVYVFVCLMLVVRLARCLTTRFDYQFASSHRILHTVLKRIRLPLARGYTSSFIFLGLSQWIWQPALATAPLAAVSS